MVTKSMPCISLWQPWASLVAHGFKQYETRSWQPPKKCIGALLAIHAAKRWTADEARYMKRFVLAYPDVREKLYSDPPLLRPPLGAILCVCRLVACYPSNEHYYEVDDKERAFGDWSPGRFVWKLEVVKVPATPIPYAGKQGIFQWEYEMP
jgi:activating signal cointegrator 1